MTYTQTTWQDDAPPPISGANLNKIESGINAAHPVASIADLKAVSVTGLVNNDHRFVLGYFAPGDGGGGLFRWNAASTASDNGGTLIIPASSPASGRWERVYEGAVNARWFGLSTTGNGSANATALQAAIDYVANLGRGKVLVPAGSYTTNKIVIKTNVVLSGEGVEATVLTLANTQNTALIESFNFASLTGTNTVASPNNFTIQNLTLDANRTNNTTNSWGLRLYGFAYLIDNVWIREPRTEGIYSEWSTSLASPGNGGMISFLSRVKVFNGSGHGIRWRGPHDSFLLQCEVFTHTSGRGIIMERTGAGLGAAGTKIMGCHVWDVGDYAYYITDSAIYLTHCLGEMASSAQVFVGGNQIQIKGGCFFGRTSDSTHIGFEIGSASAAFINGCDIDTQVQDCRGGFVKWYSGLTENKNRVTLTGNQTSSSNIEVGSPPAGTYVSYCIEGLTNYSSRDDAIAGKRLLLSNPGTDQWRFIGTLPISSGFTYDKLVVEVEGGGAWQANDATIASMRYHYMIFSNRDTGSATSGFTYYWQIAGDINKTATSARIRAYRQTDGSVGIYAYNIGSDWTQGIVRARGIGLLDNAVASGVNTTTAIELSPVLSGAPSGTLVFDSGDPATYRPNQALSLGELQSNRLISTGTSPTIGAGAGAGTTPTVSVTGKNMAGRISLTEGSSPPGTAGQTLFTVTFGTAYAAAPIVVLAPANAAASNLTGTSAAFVDRAGITTSVFVVKNSAALTAAAVYEWFYHVIQ
jgi:hypothetical protein